MKRQIPATIQKMVHATNARDTNAFLGVFSEHAVLRDWGRVYNGKAEIAKWNETDNIGVRSQLNFMRIETVEGIFHLTVTVTGQGFNGEGTMKIRIDHDLITELFID
ncbi:nuclear transport factor 2 family protein [Ensifer sp. MPMI2T]|nr:nuclear transport factor 2 family protein [Ensifer sp. MPMI2T]